MGFHPFHLVDPSPWPFWGSVSVFFFLLSSILFLGKWSSIIFFLLSFFILILIIYQWWRDVVRESTLQGMHTKEVQNGLYVGFLMFIASEIMFFFSFFFSFFFNSLCPNIEIGSIWPPEGLEIISYVGVPLLNSVILLSSGISVTWAHHSLMESKKFQTLWGLIFTIGLGLIFTWFQVEEYFESSFTLADSVYGSIFFISTGFHGIHVIVGTFFLFITMIRIMYNQISIKHFIGFELSAWYWHFVDVVWLFLFVWIYWWGS